MPKANKDKKKARNKDRLRSPMNKTQNLARSDKLKDRVDVDESAFWSSFDFTKIDTSFLTERANSITLNEIYHRIEWYLDRRHNPSGPHTIPPDIALEKFFPQMSPTDGRLSLWNAMNKISGQYIIAWNSQLFHGILLPWESKAGVVVGFKDMKVLRDMINSYAAGYRHNGWIVQ